MKKIFLITTIMLFTLSAISQTRESHGRKKDEIASMKVAFITRKLDLTPSEAQTFWPVYNQYQDALNKLREGRKSDARNFRHSADSLTDKDVEKLIDGEIAFRQGEVDLMKQYHSQFKKVLPVKKVARLYHSEDEFKRELLKRIQDRHDKRKPGSGK